MFLNGFRQPEPGRLLPRCRQHTGSIYAVHRRLNRFGLIQTSTMWISQTLGSYKNRSYLGCSMIDFEQVDCYVTISWWPSSVFPGSGRKTRVVPVWTVPVRVHKHFVATQRIAPPRSQLAHQFELLVRSRTSSTLNILSMLIQLYDPLQLKAHT